MAQRLSPEVKDPIGRPVTHRSEDRDFLIGRLASRNPLERERAARGLRDYGPDVLAPLYDALGDREPTVRAAAAESLGVLGDPGAVEPLCRALADEKDEVRVAAAAALGTLGDPRALQPLTAALQACFAGGSARRQLLTGAFVLLGAVLVGLAVVTGFALAKLGAAWMAIQFLTQGVIDYYKKRRSRSRLCGAITTALEQIAERDPAPELRAILPDLKAVAADTLQQERATREASRRAAERIEALTEKLKSLPVPSTSPGLEAEVLPRPASAPATEEQVLPRVEG